MSGPPARVAPALAWAAARLSAAGADAPRRAARLLLERAADVALSRQIACPEAPLDAARRARFAALVRRREAREPLAYILGRREFWSLDIAVSRAVLAPRPDSETVVAAALERAPAPPRRALDLGTGSGCLLLALLREWPGAFGVGVDRSAAALAVAAANARALGLGGRAAFAASDWAAALDGAFDAVVCNPPYVATGALAGLPPEIGFEPRAALDGGADGLARYRALMPGAARVTAPGGVAVFELGAGQAPAVRRIVRAAGFDEIAEHRDLSGVVRCLSARGGFQSGSHRRRSGTA